MSSPRLKETATRLGRPDRPCSALCLDVMSALAAACRAAFADVRDGQPAWDIAPAKRDKCVAVAEIQGENRAAPTSGDGDHRGTLRLQGANPRRTFVARRHDTLQSARSIWQRIEADGTASAYQTLSWASCMDEFLMAAQPASPLIVELRDGETGQPIMLVPLVCLRRYGCRVIEWLNLGVCDYAAPLLAAGIDLTPEEMARAWHAVRTVLPAADMIKISQIPADIGGRSNPLAGIRGSRIMSLHASGVAIAGDADALMGSLMRASTLRDMAKKRRRLGRIGPVSFVQAATRGDVADLFAVMMRQRRARFVDLGRFDLLMRPNVSDFYLEAAYRGLEGGPARLFGLKVGEDWIATAYGLVHGGTFHGLVLTMAGEPWQVCSPGLQIAADTMVWSRAHGLTYMDFTIGSLPYKLDFGVQTRELRELVEPLSLKGRAALHLVDAAVAGKAFLERHPALAGRLRTLRRSLRRLGAKRRAAAGQ